MLYRAPVRGDVTRITTANDYAATFPRPAPMMANGAQ
jgi:hypothetical protein